MSIQNGDGLEHFSCIQNAYTLLEHGRGNAWKQSINEDSIKSIDIIANNFNNK